jgi:hypothetical protein
MSWSQEIYGEIAVVRMLLTEVVARLNLGLALGEDLLQLPDRLLQLCSSKLFAEPKDQACYVGHGGEPLAILAGSLHAALGIKRETPPPFSFRSSRFYRSGHNQGERARRQRAEHAAPGSQNFSAQGGETPKSGLR